MKWTPDGTVLGMSWVGGGLSLWSVFGSLLTVSLRWDYSQDPLSHAITITNMVSNHYFGIEYFLHICFLLA